MSIREEVLDMAKKTITQDRQDVHGNPESTFDVIADLWNGFLKQLPRDELTSADVAMMMILFKVARYTRNAEHMDNVVDLLGYGAIAAELLSMEKTMTDGSKPLVTG